MIIPPPPQRIGWFCIGGNMDAKQFYNMTLLFKELIKELHAIREAVEPKSVDVDHIIDAINKKTQEDGKCPLIL